MKTKTILQPDGWWETIPIEFEIPVPTSNNVFITKIDNLLEIIDNVKEQQSKEVNKSETLLAKK